MSTREVGPFGPSVPASTVVSMNSPEISPVTVITVPNGSVPFGAASIVSSATAEMLPLSSDVVPPETIDSSRSSVRFAAPATAMSITGPSSSMTMSAVRL